MGPGLSLSEKGVANKVRENEPFTVELELELV